MFSIGHEQASGFPSTYLSTERLQSHAHGRSTRTNYERRQPGPDSCKPCTSGSYSNYDYPINFNEHKHARTIGNHLASSSFAAG